MALKTTIKFDDFTYQKRDNVFQILPEEQELAWYLYHNIILKHALHEKGSIPFLEVGCGSGFFSINVGKSLGKEIYTIDINPRAVEFTKKNAVINKTNVLASLANYEKALFEKESINVILLNPPFHIYPQCLEPYLPIFSVGGSDGQTEFKRQLEVANYHLAKNGIIVFIMMCMGKKTMPSYIDYYKDITNNECSIFYHNIFEPISTELFLKSVYGDEQDLFVNQQINKYSKIYFTNGYLIKDYKGTCKEIFYDFKMNNRSWSDRILLHKQINKLLRNE